MDDGLSEAITALTDSADHEEDHLRSKIEALRAEIAVVAVELSELQTTLAAFEIRYDARIGVLIAELDRLNLSIEEYQRRIDSLSQPPETRQEAEEEILREFKAERKRVETEYDEASAAGERVADLPPEPDADTTDQFRDLYRQLARQYHPDLAGSDEERVENEQAMKRINVAMDARDLDALVQLELELPHKIAMIHGTTRQGRISWALAEIARLEAALATTIGKMAVLRASSIYQLWERTQHDSALLSLLEDELSAEIRAAQSTLDTLLHSYRESVANAMTVTETSA